MGAADTDAETAAAQLKLIANHYTARAAPRGDVVQMPSSRPSRPAHPPMPINTGIVEHMQAAVAEIITHTQAAAPDAGPAPTDNTAVYEWMRDHTRTLDEHRRLAAEAIVYRQTLEHAIALGDHTVVHRHPCPACGCFSLFWRGTRQRAVCVYKRCPGMINGQSRTWPLKQIAYEHVQARKESPVRHAT